MTNPNDPVDTHEARTDFSIFKGLTKREYMAAMAMNGLISCDLRILQDICPKNESIAKYISRQSVVMADALIARLSK